MHSITASTLWECPFPLGKSYIAKTDWSGLWFHYILTYFIYIVICVLYYTNKYSCLVTSHPLFREACPSIVSDNDVTAPFAAIVAIIQSQSTWSQKKKAQETPRLAKNPTSQLGSIVFSTNTHSECNENSQLLHIMTLCSSGTALFHLRRKTRIPLARMLLPHCFDIVTTFMLLGFCMKMLP